MSIFDQFGTDHTKEEEGVWIDFGPNSDGTNPSFKIARMSSSNKKFALAVEKATKPFTFANGKLKTIPKDKSDELFLNVFCEVVLLDWKHVQTKHGEEIPYTKENAKDLMKKLPELYSTLQNHSGEMSLYLEEEKDENSKN